MTTIESPNVMYFQPALQQGTLDSRCKHTEPSSVETKRDCRVLKGLRGGGEKREGVFLETWGKQGLLGSIKN